MRIRRQLAEGSPAAYLPDLAGSLNNLAAFLSEVGRGEEALEAAQESVGRYRELAESSPAAYLPGLAGSLNTLANHLSDVGRREEALKPARRRCASAGSWLNPVPQPIYPTWPCR